MEVTIYFGQRFFILINFFFSSRYRFFSKKEYYVLSQSCTDLFVFIFVRQILGKLITFLRLVTCIKIKTVQMHVQYQRNIVYWKELLKSFLSRKVLELN